MTSGPSIIRKSGTSNGPNLELVNSLRANFSEAKRDYAAAAAITHQPNGRGNVNNGFITNGISVNGNGTNRHTNGAVSDTDSHSGTLTPPTPVDVWTERHGKVLYVPRINWHAAGLRDERDQYELTVKIFFLPGTPVSLREQYTRDALALVRKELGVETFDLLVAAFPDISFEGTCEWEADKRNAHQGNLDEELNTWKIFEDLVNRGVVKRLGVSEFGSEKLSAFIKRASVPPAVNQINLHDCCNVPPPLKQLAEAHRIELNVHRDSTDILPPGTLRELLGSGWQGANVLADEESGGIGLQGNIVPQWVVRYMAFVRDRGVIENKGYFAGAELVEA